MGGQEGNQEPTTTPDAMVQPFTTIPFPPPPQNGIPTEYGVPHTQDYAGQTSEHNLTLYGSTQAHGEQSSNSPSTQNGSLTVCSHQVCHFSGQVCGFLLRPPPQYPKSSPPPLAAKLLVFVAQPYPEELSQKS
ncbi:hypothetical protein J1605_020358 [Eschrichtius robustus]|uniref:Uncharacterized protein n=1 Tax=Eschrichtius robustus TaxID=9764 RepID=A0AB34HFN7_ESCRO|nr:hypothetical protein J1605_020358 [Eschrichtius robustus]